MGTEPHGAVDVRVGAARLRRRGAGQRLVNGGWALYAVGVAVGIAGTLSGHGAVSVELGFYFGMFGALIGAFGAVLGVATRLSVHRAFVEGATLLVDGEGVRRRRWRNLRHRSRATRGIIVVDASDAELSLDVAPADAAALLAALGPTSPLRRFRWYGSPSRWLLFVAGLIGFGTFLFTAASRVASVAEVPTASTLTFLAATSILAELLSRIGSFRVVTIGPDAVEVRQIGGSALVRVHEVVDVARRGALLEIRTRDGRLHPIPVDGDDDLCAAIERHLRQATEAPSARADSSLAMLLRGERSVSDWRAELVRFGRAAIGFRDGAPGTDVLCEVLCDASAAPEQRLAAAIALGASPTHRPRIRVAAETCARPQLRVALEQLAQGEADDHVVESALEEARR